MAASGRRRRGSGGGLPGFLKFLIFALVLAAIVLGRRADRPPADGRERDHAARRGQSGRARRAVRRATSWRENLGDGADGAGLDRPAQVEFLVESGDTATTIATRLEEQGFLADSRAFVFIAIEQDLTGALQQGTFILRKNHAPRTSSSAPCSRRRKIQYVDIALRTGLRLEQITAKLETLTALTDGPRATSTARQVTRPPSSSPTTRG